MYPLKIFVIAGEKSGDLLGGAILKALAAQSGRRLEIEGIGGDSIKDAGMGTSVIPMKMLGVMGIAEILPKLFFFIRTIRSVVVRIEEFKPDLIITVDSPDFSFRIQKNIRNRKRLHHGKQIHVVAPSVWAWRPGRAQKIAKFLDGLICFFPFEPPFFIRHGLDSIAIGHPAINAPIAWVDPSPLYRALDLKEDDIVLGIYLGSRGGIVERHAPVFIEAINRLAESCPNLCVLIPTFPEYADRVRSLCNNLSVRHHVITDPLLKPVAMRACHYALAVSGTVGLELAIANVPHIVGYKMNFLTWIIGRFMVKKGQFAHLANIVENKKIVPELIQGHCTAKHLSSELSQLMESTELVDEQKRHFVSVREKIGQNAQEKPAEKAARFILEHL